MLSVAPCRSGPRSKAKGVAAIRSGRPTKKGRSPFPSVMKWASKPMRVKVAGPYLWSLGNGVGSGDAWSW